MTSRSICQTDRVLNDLSYIHQIDAVPARARAEAIRGNLKQRADGVRCRWHRGASPSVFSTFVWKGEKKKNSLSTTITRIEGSLVTPRSPSLFFFLSVSQCIHTHDNTNIDRFSAAVDRSCHPAPPIERTFFFSLLHTLLLFYQRPIRSTGWLFQSKNFSFLKRRRIQKELTVTFTFIVG
jgi:hypothetical protein